MWQDEYAEDIKHFGHPTAADRDSNPDPIPSATKPQIVDAYGAAPVYGYRCSPECLAYMGYGHHVNCEQIEMVPKEAKSNV